MKKNTEQKHTNTNTYMHSTLSQTQRNKSHVTGQIIQACDEEYAKSILKVQRLIPRHRHS